MWKPQVPLWVVCSQSAAFLLSFKGDSSDVLAPLTPREPTVWLNTGWPLGDIQRGGWLCCYSWLLTKGSLPSLKHGLNLGRTKREYIVLWIQQDNWPIFRDTGAHSAALLTSPFDVWYHFPFDIHLSVCSKAYIVRVQSGDQHFPPEPAIDRDDLILMIIVTHSSSFPSIIFCFTSQYSA